MRAVWNVFAREPRAPIAKEATAAARSPQQPAVWDVVEREHAPARQQRLDVNLPSQRLIGNMIWTSWPARDSSLREDYLRPNSVYRKSQDPRISAGQENVSQPEDVHVEANVLNEELAALDALFARRATDW
jgi:hypothetical protein